MSTVTPNLGLFKYDTTNVTDLASAFNINTALNNNWDIIDSIATDLNSKADTNLSNTNNQAKILMSGMGMPSIRYIDLTLGASGSTYTAPANGWFTLRKIANSDGSANDKYCEIYNNTSSTGVHNNGMYGFLFICTIPVLKGDIIQINYNATGNTDLFRFIYAQGSESEAS